MTEVRRNIPSFSTVTSSFKSYITSLPLLTTTITCISILLYVFEYVYKALFSNTIYNLLSLSPVSFFNGQVWRLVTFPYPSDSLGNILFNLLAFLPLSTAIEHTIDVNIGGLSIWMFGVVVWESRELAGRERDIFGLFRVPAHFYPVVLLLLMEILFPPNWFASHLCGLFAGYFYSFGYLSCIIPPPGYFSNLENKFSYLSNLRGFVKADEGSRGGWWLPLWSQDVDGLEDSLEFPIHSNNGSGAIIGGDEDDHGIRDNNVRDSGHVSGDDDDNTLLNPTSATPQNARSVSPEISTPVFVVPSSNESSRANSPQPRDNSPLTDNRNSEDPLKITTTTQISNDIEFDSLLHQDISSKDIKLCNLLFHE
ncbi:Rhomboid-like protein 15 isoform X1 [Rhizophagus clarus]|uniref:Rhomboid-like protein 15 isoform X1 n=1 Tax=Rhizophagus clarus TaxID=94130 RepID=A0A8H3MCM5_9GLOM|nr:Rhomboid-like protein 15 isoform X1 [Rhizophagus clarus]